MNTHRIPTLEELESPAYAITRLQETLLPVGTEIGTLLVHQTRSGAASDYALIISNDHPSLAPMNITPIAARALGTRLQDSGGIRAGGYGLNRAFHIVYTLGRTLWPEGFRCTGNLDRFMPPPTSGPLACPSNDHRNGDRTTTRVHQDGGYAYNHRML